MKEILHVQLTPSGTRLAVDHNLALFWGEQEMCDVFSCTFGNTLSVRIQRILRVPRLMEQEGQTHFPKHAKNVDKQTTKGMSTERANMDPGTERQCQFSRGVRTLLPRAG